MGNQDFASAGKARAITPGEGNAFRASDVERLARGTEQAPSEELGADCENAAQAGFELKSVARPSRSSKQ